MVAAKHVRAGQALLALNSRSARSAWPPPGLGVPRGPPQLHDSVILRAASARLQHSADWTLERCPLCQQYWLSLVAVSELEPGSQITLRQGPPTE